MTRDALKALIHRHFGASRFDLCRPLRRDFFSGTQVTAKKGRQSTPRGRTDARSEAQTGAPAEALEVL